MTNKPMRAADGKYHIRGKIYPELIGSRQQVWNGTAYKTAGGLCKDDLLRVVYGKRQDGTDVARIVSKKKHQTAKKEMRLQRYGYYAKKGEFGIVKRTPNASVRGSRRNTRKSRR